PVEVALPPDANFVARNFIINIQQLKFEKPGQDAMDIAIDGRQEASIPLHVKQMPPRKEGRSGRAGAAPGARRLSGFIPECSRFGSNRCQQVLGEKSLPFCASRLRRTGSSGCLTWLPVEQVIWAGVPGQMQTMHTTRSTQSNNSYHKRYSSRE